MRWASPRLNRPSSATAASVKFPICSICRAARCLENAQRPILPVTLGGDHPGVYCVKRVLVPVECGKNP